jgi:hypothetical protein
MDIHISELRLPHILFTSQAALVVFPEPGGPYNNMCWREEGLSENIEKH